MGNKRGSRCLDCGGPHGRGYYKCPTPYKNVPDEEPPQREDGPSLEYAARMLLEAWDDGEFTEGGDPTAHIELLRQSMTQKGIEE